MSRLSQEKTPEPPSPVSIRCQSPARRMSAQARGCSDGTAPDDRCTDPHGTPTVLRTEVARLQAGDARAIRPRLLFLEDDPWSMGSGYTNEHVVRVLARHRFDPEQQRRVARVLLYMVDIGDRSRVPVVLPTCSTRPGSLLRAARSSVESTGDIHPRHRTPTSFLGEGPKGSSPLAALHVGRWIRPSNSPTSHRRCRTPSGNWNTPQTKARKKPRPDGISPTKPSRKKPKKPSDQKRVGREPRDVSAGHPIGVAPHLHRPLPHEPAEYPAANNPLCPQGPLQVTGPTSATGTLGRSARR